MAPEHPRCHRVCAWRQPAAVLPRLGMGRAWQGLCTPLPGDSMRAKTLPLLEGLSLPPREGTAMAWHYAMSNAVTARRSLYPCLDVQPCCPHGSSAIPPWAGPLASNLAPCDMLPRGPMIWGTGATGIGLGAALGLLSCLGPAATSLRSLSLWSLSLLVPTNAVNCPRPRFLPSATSEVPNSAWGCEGGTRGTGCSRGRACGGCRCLWDLSLCKVHTPPFSNPKP